MKTRGFTLIELMIVTVIIAILAAIAIPAFKDYKSETNVVCVSQSGSTQTFRDARMPDSGELAGFVISRPDAETEFRYKILAGQTCRTVQTKVKKD